MKNFFDQNDEKITEKSFTRTLVISIISIALCIIALCSITFAWFSDETTSVSNTLSSGSFDITVSVLDPDGVDLSADYIDGDVYSYTLDAGTYVVSLDRTPESNVNGHCIVTIGDGSAMHTNAILNVSSDTSDFTFTLVIIEPTVLTLESRWGIVAAPDINSGDVIDLATNDNQ